MGQVCDIRLWMRKIVGGWMSDVVQEEVRREVNTFELAVQLLDRYLSLYPSKIKRDQLQLMGAACLLTSSKLNESLCLSISILVNYSDKCFKAADLSKMELQLLTDLQWDIHGLTASDFVDHFCLRIDELYGEKEGIKYVDRKKMGEEGKKLLNIMTNTTKP